MRRFRPVHPAGSGGSIRMRQIGRYRLRTWNRPKRVRSSGGMYWAFRLSLLCVLGNNQTDPRRAATLYARVVRRRLTCAILPQQEFPAEVHQQHAVVLDDIGGRIIPTARMINSSAALPRHGRPRNKSGDGHDGLGDPCRTSIIWAAGISLTTRWLQTQVTERAQAQNSSMTDRRGWSGMYVR